MATKVQFTDNSAKVKASIDERTISFLEEAKSSIAAQASKNSPVRSGDLKRSFQSDSKVVESEKAAYIGSSLEYSIWQEYGTGEFALKGNGRKGGWVYKDPDTGKYVFTRGNKPRRMLYHAFQQKKASVEKRAQEVFRSV
jgi:HK97 gp10 family phage protein